MLTWFSGLNLRNLQVLVKQEGMSMPWPSRLDKVGPQEFTAPFIIPYVWFLSLVHLLHPHLPLTIESVSAHKTYPQGLEHTKWPIVSATGGKVLRVSLLNLPRPWTRALLPCASVPGLWLHQARASLSKSGSQDWGQPPCWWAGASALPPHACHPSWSSPLLNSTTCTQ